MHHLAKGLKKLVIKSEISAFCTKLHWEMHFECFDNSNCHILRRIADFCKKVMRYDNGAKTSF